MKENIPVTSDITEACLKNSWNLLPEYVKEKLGGKLEDSSESNPRKKDLSFKLASQFVDLKLKDKNLARKILTENTVSLFFSGMKNITVLKYATGVGKSLMAIACLERYLFYAKNVSSRILIVCKETNHIQNWKNLMLEHGISTDRYDFCCYPSIGKYAAHDFIILDECHAVTANYLSKFKVHPESTKKIIGLTATLPAEKELLLKKFFEKQIKGALPSIYQAIKLDMKQAIQIGILPEPRINIHRIFLEELDDVSILLPVHYPSYPGSGDGPNTTLTLNFDVSDESAKTINLVGSGNTIKLASIAKLGCVDKPVKVRLNMSAKAWYKILDAKVEKLKDSYDITGSKGVKNLWLQAASERKRTITSFKTKQARLIREHYKNSRSITFCGSIKQAEEIAHEMTPITSKTSKAIRKQLIEDFNAMKSNELISVKMLREGMNLKKISVGNIVQLDSSTLSFIQMLGRSFRSELPIVNIFVVMGTRDEDYLEGVIDEIPRKFIHYVN